MAMKVLACLLALTVTAQAASIASLDIIDNLQELLLNPEAMGARMKRSTSDNWDKEFVLDVVGIAFQLKYVDPSNPLKGGHAHIKFPGKKFITGAPFDDMDLDIEFHGGNSPRDGLFDMKIKYKFVEKFTFLADRPQEGEVMIHRKLEGGMWKSRMSVTNSNRQPSPFFDVTIDSDRLTKFYATFKYDADNEWVLKIDRVPGQSITGVAVINGEEYKFIGTLDQAAKKLNVKIMGHGITHNVDLKMTTTGEWGFTVTGDVFGPIDFKLAVDQKFKKIDFVAKYKNKNYAFVKLTGDNVMRGLIPTKVDYIMKYNIMDSEMEGKAKINLDLTSMARTLKISFVPRHGKDLNMDFNLEGPLDKAFTFKMDTNRDGVTYTKFEQYVKFQNTAEKLMVDTKFDITMDPFSVFYNFFCWKVGRCMTTGHREINLVYMKNDKNFLFGKTKFDDKSIVDGRKFQEKKLDTMSTPYTMMWYQPSGPYWMVTPYTLFGMDMVEVKAWHTVGKELKIESNIEDMKFDIRRNPDYFVEFIKSGETMLKVKTDITPAMFNADIETIIYLPSHSLFHKVFCMYGRGCFNKRQGHMKISVDRVNKNALVNKFKVESNIHKDNVKVLDLTMDTMTTPYHFNVNAPYVLPRFFGDSTRKTIDATITHQKGQKLEIHTNCPEFETFLINTAGSKRTITMNGRELMVLDHTNGEKRVSQTMELASGEHLTTTVEWTKDSVKDNKATVTVDITPNRKFKGVVDWDFKNPLSSKVEFDVEGTNPTIGEYKITRKGDWHFTNPTYILNWSGKTRFASGPLAVMSPMDTFVHVNFNKNKKTLDAEIVETIGGKKWGVTVNSNKFTMLAGRA